MTFGGNLHSDLNVDQRPSAILTASQSSSTHFLLSQSNPGPTSLESYWSCWRICLAQLSEIKQNVVPQCFLDFKGVSSKILLCTVILSDSLKSVLIEEGLFTRKSTYVYKLDYF